MPLISPPARIPDPGQPDNRDAMKTEMSNRPTSEGLLRFERNFLAGILETTAALIIVLDSGGRVLRLNRAVEKWSGYNILDSVGTYVWDQLLWRNEVQDFVEAVNSRNSSSFPLEFQSRLKTSHGNDLWVYWSSTAILDDTDAIEYILTTGIDITALKKAESERERLIDELQQALTKVKTLRGLLPICASCKKIRDDQGYWQGVDDYIRKHSLVEFSHGICPACAHKLYPEFFPQLEEGK
jgi:PAS domain S-box-containing protein